MEREATGLPFQQVLGFLTPYNELARARGEGSVECGYEFIASGGQIWQVSRSVELFDESWDHKSGITYLTILSPAWHGFPGPMVRTQTTTQSPNWGTLTSCPGSSFP